MNIIWIVIAFILGLVDEAHYESLYEKFGKTVVGIDLDATKVLSLQALGKDVIQGSATDPDFWTRLHIDEGKVQLVVFKLPNQKENLFASEQLDAAG